jgi:hypothetical protein
MVRPQRAARRGCLDAAIRRQIKNCALFLPIISANTCARRGLLPARVETAIDRSHLIAADRPFLVPVAVDGTPKTTNRFPTDSANCSGRGCPVARPRRPSSSG